MLIFCSTREENEWWVCLYELYFIIIIQKDPKTKMIKNEPSEEPQYLKKKAEKFSEENGSMVFCKLRSDKD